MSAFSTCLSGILAERAMKQIDLVRAMRADGNPISFQYVHFLVKGDRIPPPDLVEKISRALKLDKQQRMKFHWAAAIDSGYRIGKNGGL